MKDTKYGFYTEEYEGCSVEVLMTGDGMPQFTEMVHNDGKVGIGIAYSVGNGVIGETVELDKLLEASDQVTWEVKFDNLGSVQAMINCLEGIKKTLTEGCSVE